jgi:glycosyltransferase involved in cell wall biosynthesis
MPVFNGATRHPFLKEAIDSFRRQTYKDKELIIVNDGSTDNTHAKILEIAGKRERTRDGYIDDDIRLFLRMNRGQAAAQNFGLAASYGEFITLLDDDDLFYSDTSLGERMSNFTDDIDVLITSYAEQYGDKAQVVDMETDIEKLKSIIWGKPGAFALQGVTWRKSISGKVGEWDEKLTSAEDVDMKIRFLHECKCKAINIPTYRHRYHPNMRSDAHRRSGELDRNKTYLIKKLEEKYGGR